MASLTLQQSQSSVDWQTTKQTVRERTAFLFNNSLMSDIKFVVTDSQHESDGRQVRVPAHKLVLAISSPVFDVMFYSMLAEKGEEIKLPDIDSTSLLAFLRFIYCDVVHLTIDNVLGVLYVATKYIVRALADECSLFLKRNTDETNAFQILEAAKLFDLSELEKRCWKFIDDDTSACLESDQLLSLSHDTLVSLLKRDTLSGKELPLFEAVKRWAEAKCEDEKTGGVIRKILKDAIEFIRFPTMSREEFERYVVPTKILTRDEYLQMQQFYIHGAIPASLMKFSCSYREGAFKLSSLYRCGRVIVSEDSPMRLTECNELTEKMSFKTDKEIHLRGVSLYASCIMDQRFNAMVRVTAESGDFATVEGTFQVGNTCTGLSQFRYGFDVVFKTPVRVRASSKYVIHAEVKSMNYTKVYCYSFNPVLSVNNSGVKFTFERFPGTAHILELLFYILN